MTYELAKELMDAGFPQKSMNVGSPAEYTPEGAYIPTLSELIEACGELDFHLQHFVGADWGAWGGLKVGHGPNPEEAAARLWLALHPMNETHQGQNRPTA